MDGQPKPGSNMQTKGEQKVIPGDCQEYMRKQKLRGKTIIMTLEVMSNENQQHIKVGRKPF